LEWNGTHHLVSAAAADDDDNLLGENIDDVN
jgi:hypothetical protein